MVAACLRYRGGVEVHRIDAAAEVRERVCVPCDISWKAKIVPPVSAFDAP